MRRLGSFVLLAVILSLGAARDRPAGAAEGPRLDVAAATTAYLAKVPPDKKASSDAYFEGGYWLQLWDFLYAAGLFWLLLGLGWSAGMRDRAERWAGRLGPAFKWLSTPLYWAQFLLVLSVLQFPLGVYEGYFREHQYGLATQTFGPWMWDQVKGFLVNLVLLGILLTALYAVLRRARLWWVWGSIVSVLFLLFAQIIAPVFIFPLFNTFTRLEDPAIREPILRLARANGIPANDVYVMDASRQTTRVSANVSGFLGTTRVTLNDNLLRRANVQEIEAVMGHEMGHYVLHHNYKGSVFNALITVLGFVFLNTTFAWTVRRHGGRWRVGGVGDLAGLPLIALLLSLYGFVLTPLTNSVTRTMEAEADLFGLNASRQPDGAAEVALMLGEYRKLDPGPMEEVVFYDHPSGRSRITMAMRWKAENMPAAQEPAAAP